jgi:hypothetical protein
LEAAEGRPALADDGARLDRIRAQPLQVGGGALEARGGGFGGEAALRDILRGHCAGHVNGRGAGHLGSTVGKIGARLAHARLSGRDLAFRRARFRFTHREFRASFSRIDRKQELSAVHEVTRPDRDARDHAAHTGTDLDVFGRGLDHAACPHEAAWSGWGRLDRRLALGGNHWAFRPARGDGPQADRTAEQGEQRQA